MLLESLKMKIMSHSKNKPKLLCDENIPLELIETLNNEGFDAKRVELGSKDKQIFTLSKSEERILVSSDKHFLNKIKFPPKESSGIVFIDMHPPLIETIHFSLTKLFKSVNLSEFKGRLFRLTSSGFKVFPRF